MSLCFVSMGCLLEALNESLAVGRPMSLLLIWSNDRRISCHQIVFDASELCVCFCSAALRTCS